MKKMIIVLGLMILLTASFGCTLNMKTRIVADYKSLESVDTTELKKTQLQALIGSPQAKGVQLFAGKKYDLYFYTGFIGRASMSSMQVDSGTVFATLDNEKCVHLLYRLAKSENSIERDRELPIDTFFNRITVGKSTVKDVLDILGEPPYRGRRINFLDNITHSILWYDASKVTRDKPVIEKWIVVGYDKNEVVQDIMWVSSSHDDVKKLGKVESKEVQVFYNNDIYSQFLNDEGVSVTTGKINASRVDALLKTSPQNITDIVKIIGLPSAVGVRLFKETDALIMSSWSHANAKVIGKEQEYYVMDIKLSQLIVWHDSKGDIKEYFWFRPE